MEVDDEREREHTRVIIDGRSLIKQKEATNRAHEETKRAIQ